ncbi:MAG: hypothetical protein E7406_08845 [Ruminococcaceae bacterium]|nr:hypothetical protein [Oscillospiraceae bacterium]
MEENRILTKADVRVYLKIGRDAVNKLFKQPDLRVIYFGNQPRVLEADLIAYVKDHRGTRIVL